MGSLSGLYNLIDAEKTGDEKAISLAMEGLTEKHRELLETSQVNATFLVKEEVYSKVIEGAEKVMCMRDVMKPMTFKMPTPSYRFIVKMTDTSRVLPEVPATAEYSVAPNQSYKEVTFTAKKYGELPSIEEELISDAMFDIVEMRLREIGTVAENTLNQKCIDMVIGNAANGSTWSSSTPIASMVPGVEQMKKDGFYPDTLILSAAAEGDLFADPHFRYEYSGETGNFRTAEIGTKILGMKPYLLTTASTNASWGEAGGVLAVILDSSKLGGLGMRQDIEIEKFDEPKNDLLNLKISTRFDVQAFNGKAAFNFS